MWDKLEYPPQPFGKCSICNRHDCGEVVIDGVKEQRWLHMPLELFIGGDLHIGYQCVRGMSEDLGVAVRVVEKEIHVEPSDEQVLRVFRGSLAVPNPLETYFNALDSTVPISDEHGETVNYPSPEKQKTRKRGASK